MNDMNELYSIRMIGEPSLQHYGVLGMKWGHRKSQLRDNMSSARLAYKKANKAYNKAFNRAYEYSARHPVSQFVSKKKKTESDKRWNDAYNAAKNTDKAKAAYKSAKKEYRTERNAAYKKTVISNGHKFVAKLLESNEKWFRNNNMSEAANMYKRDKERHSKAANNS